MMWVSFAQVEFFLTIIRMKPTTEQEQVEEKEAQRVTRSIKGEPGDNGNTKPAGGENSRWRDHLLYKYHRISGLESA